MKHIAYSVPFWTTICHFCNTTDKSQLVHLHKILEIPAIQELNVRCTQMDWKTHTSGYWPPIYSLSIKLDILQLRLATFTIVCKSCHNVIGIWELFLNSALLEFKPISVLRMNYLEPYFIWLKMRLNDRTEALQSNIICIHRVYCL